MNDAERRVLAGAADAYGLITREQARRFGMSEHQIDARLANERWEVLHPCVYRVRGAPATARQRLLAANLWMGTDAVVSHTAAGRLLRLDAVPRPTVIDVSTPHPTGRRHLRAHDARLDRIDCATVDSIPCTSATRTPIDLAARLDEESLEVAFESARRLGLTATTALASRVEALCGRGRPGSALARHLVRVVERRPLESKLEVKVARLLRANDLRAPANQFEVGAFRLDFAWPRLKLAVECDGFEHHGQRLVWKRDRRRIAWLEAHGWRVVHVTWDDVTKHPDRTIDRIRTARQRAA